MLRDVVAAVPTHAGAMQGLGLIAYQTGRIDEAIRHMSAAVEADPQFGEAFNNFGIIQAERGDMNAAAACFEKAAQLQQDNPEVFMN